MTRYLLDTHTFLWLASDDARLSDECKRVYLDAGSDLYLSVASVWEMALKVSLGKLVLGRPLRRLLEIATNEQSIRLLNISPEHALQVESLPFHHRDPFDRLIIAQSLIEGFPVVGRDEAFDAYGVTRVW